LTLQCPFCDAPEDERIAGVDESGNSVVLLMFDCPFFYQLPQELASKTENEIQSFLNDWREEYGEDWLENVGPIMKNRELKNIEKSGKSSQSRPG
jgi:hypothetical protein